MTSYDKIGQTKVVLAASNSIPNVDAKMFELVEQNGGQRPDVS